jgi:SAM-dependent methyltransferase
MFDTYAEIFEKRASEYHFAMKRWPMARAAEFKSVLEPLDEVADGLVCDMPSGGGYLADHLRRGLEYVAVDPASGFFVEWEKPRQRITAEITNVQLADASVDHIVSLAGLHHEPSLPAVCSEMRRLLRPGGRLVIADAAVGTSPARFLNGFVAANNPMGHDGRFLDDRTAGLLQQAGFALLSEAQVPVPWVFDSLEEAGEFGRHLFGLTSLSPSAVAEALSQHIGFDTVDGRPRLRWTLYRIVGVAI